MPITSSALSGLVKSAYVAAMPTCTSATFSVEKGGQIIPFLMIDCMCEAFVSVIKTPSVLSFTYTGSVGTTGVVTPVPLSFPLATTEKLRFISISGWSGTASLAVADAFVGKVASLSSTLALVNVPPIPGGAVGTAIINAAAMSAKEALLKTQFQAALVSAFSSKIGADGLPLFIITEQLNALCANLSSVYAKILSGVVCTAPVVGVPTAPTAPLVLPVTGSIV